jgi:hypothetical protein
MEGVGEGAPVCGLAPQYRSGCIRIPAQAPGAGQPIVGFIRSTLALLGLTHLA